MAIGILTGSGTYALPGFAGNGPEPVDTPWGEALVSRGDLGGRRRAAHLPPRRRAPAAVQPRHAPGEHRRAEAAGRGRRAGRDGLRRGRSRRRARARWSASTTCTSSPTGCRTASCARSSREPGARERGHWIYEGPFSPGLRAALLAGAAEAGVAVRDGGCYGHVDGPRFNTRAEIRGLAACGVTAVSQTAGPETVLCGEAELPYALLGYLDRLRQRRQGRGDAGRDADRDDGRVDRGVRRGPARRAAARRPPRAARRASSTASSS